MMTKTVLAIALLVAGTVAEDAAATLGKQIFDAAAAPVETGAGQKQATTCYKVSVAYSLQRTCIAVFGIAHVRAVHACGTGASRPCTSSGPLSLKKLIG